MIADTGTPDQNKVFSLRALEAHPGNTTVLPTLARLDREDRPEVAASVILNDAASFDLTVDTLAPCPGTLELQKITDTNAFRQFTKLLDEKEETAPIERTITAGLHNLGLIANAAAAEGLIAYLTDHGVIAADPRLALLRLNASLKE
jgi:hypothetical protein